MLKEYVVGIDEVGRGPLAGPITVGAVASKATSNFQLQISERKILKDIKDSKQLSAIQREKWANRIMRYKLGNKKFEVAIASVGSSTIDKIGITKAAKLAVSRCIKKLKIANCKLKILLDGNLCASRTYQNQQTIIKGDEKIPIIAAASIIAKVKRDKYMARLHKKYPEYKFASHKGYGTALHILAIKKHGLTNFHRKTFCSKLI